MSEALKLFEINELVRFYGQVISTEGVDDKNKTKCNEFISRLLGLSATELDKLTAKGAGIQLVN